MTERRDRAPACKQRSERNVQVEGLDRSTGRGAAVFDVARRPVAVAVTLESRPNASTLTLISICLMVILAVPAQGSWSSFRSPTTGTSCRTLVSADVQEITCAGPGSYVAVITSRGGVIRINYVPSSGLATPFPGGDLLWRGLAPFYGDQIEWRMARNRPFAAILHIHTVGPDERPLEQILIAKVTSGSSCEIARIDALGSAVDATARHIADSQANNVACEHK